MEEFEDMFENQFEDHDDEISKAKREVAAQEMMDTIKDRLARTNYNAIVKYGVDVDRLDKPEVIKAIIHETLKYFEEIEEYEKCSKLKSVLEVF